MRSGSNAVVTMVQAGDHHPPTTPEGREALDSVARLLDSPRDPMPQRDTRGQGPPSVLQSAETSLVPGLTTALLEALPLGAGLLRDDALVFANAALATALGFPSGAELVNAGGALLAEPLPARASDQATALRLRALTSTGQTKQVTLSVRRLAHAEPALDLVTVVEPVTPATGAEADALAASEIRKFDFLAKVSHEVRTPLNSIIGFTELMIEERLGSIENPKYKSYIDDIHRSGLYALSLINDLLDISKAEAGHFELAFAPVDAEAVSHEAVNMMQPQARRGRTVLRTAIAPGLPLVLADPRRLKQILLNLLSNAIKFTEAGGQVVLSVGVEGGGMRIRVKDSGVGMSESEVLLAMQPFRQLDTSPSRHVGTGLGLPLTKALVEASKAAFAISSEPNVGTVVDIFFPPERIAARQIST